VEDTRRVLQTRRSWMANHVKRKANSAAYNLTKHALLNSKEKTWIEECPKCIVDIVCLEQYALLS
jgi:hypothetical protein